MLYYQKDIDLVAKLDRNCSILPIQFAHFAIVDVKCYFPALIMSRDCSFIFNKIVMYKKM